jgi:hypothetical protein
MALMVTTASAADDYTSRADFMLPYCKLALNTKEAFANPENAFFSGICDGTVHAVSIMLQFNKTDYPVCVPGDMTQDQMIKVVVRYGELHPTNAHVVHRVCHKCHP